MLCSKISKNTGILYRIKGILPQKTMLTLFHSFIQSHLNHCSLIWGLGTKNSIKKLFVCQKKAIRTLIPGPVNHYYNKSTDQLPTHTKETFTNLNIMTVYSLILKNLMIFMNKKNKLPQLIPQSISSLFIDHTNIENIQHTTNSEPDAHDANSAPTAISDRLASATNSIFIKGPRLYNEITDEANEANAPFLTHTTNAYKNTVKSYLMIIQSKAAALNGRQKILDCVQQNPLANLHV